MTLPPPNHVHRQGSSRTRANTNETTILLSQIDRGLSGWLANHCSDLVESQDIGVQDLLQSSDLSLHSQPAVVVEALRIDHFYSHLKEASNRKNRKQLSKKKAESPRYERVVSKTGKGIMLPSNVSVRGLVRGERWKMCSLMQNVLTSDLVILCLASFTTAKLPLPRCRSNSYKPICVPPPLPVLPVDFVEELDGVLVKPFFLSAGLQPVSGVGPGCSSIAAISQTIELHACS